MMARSWWFCASAICLLATGLFAREGIVTTRDGRTLSGDIQEDPDGKSINITLHGGTLTVSRDNVLRINYPADAERDYRERLAALDPNDITGRLDLSRYELDAHQYDLAADAARDAERLDPHNPDAAMLLDTIQSQRNLDSKVMLATSPSAPETSAESVPANEKGHFLTLEDVEAIRRGELTAGDTVRVQFFNKVREQYASSLTNPADFYAEPEVRQALDILYNGAPAMAKDVRPATDPRIMSEYRTRVQPRILVGCAAAGCHNSEGSGGFMLYTDATDTLPAYTNYYILSRTGRTLEGGDTFGSGPIYRPMIDRLHPDDSLMLQYGLPRSMATTPHPDVPSFKPMFTGLTDPGYLEISRWIHSLAPIVPDYGIKFALPSGKSPTTQGS
jgi:hypothetical protein